MKKEELAAVVKMVLVLGILTAVTVAVLLTRHQNGPSLGADFVLNHRGQAWRFTDHARELNLLYVGYAKCPDVCPLRLSFVRQALLQLNDQDRAQVLPILISVDAANDTPEIVADYASQFLPDYVGLTGTQTELNKAITPFGATYSRNSAPESRLGYTIAHTDRLFFVDRGGRVVDSLQAPSDVKLILAKVKEYL